MSLKRKIVISILSLCCVFATIMGVGVDFKKTTKVSADVTLSQSSGDTFTSSNYYSITNLATPINTIEAWISVPTTYAAETTSNICGTIFGNYYSSSDTGSMTLQIAKNATSGKFGFPKLIIYRQGVNVTLSFEIVNNLSSNLLISSLFSCSSFSFSIFFPSKISS